MPAPCTYLETPVVTLSAVSSILKEPNLIMQAALGLTGQESYTTEVPEDIQPGQRLTVKVRKGSSNAFKCSIYAHNVV